MSTTGLGPRDRSRDYVAFMECDAGDRWMPEVDAQLGSWLREKGFDVDLAATGDHALGASQLTVRRLSEACATDLQVRLVEDAGQGGVWTTELMAHDEPGHRDWISLTVGSSLGSFVAVPRLARYLMQVLPLRDSTLDFTDKPQVFGEADIDRLVELLSDAQRHGVVFVAGSNSVSGIPLQPYVDKVGVWAKQVFGLAQVIVLDPTATEAFTTRVGEDFHAPAWAIRTFQSGVRFDDSLDRRRHRILGTSRLVNQSDKAIQFLLGEVARQQAATRPLDSSLIRVSRRFARLETRRLVEQLEAGHVDSSVEAVVNAAATENRPDGGIAPSSATPSVTVDTRPEPGPDERDQRLTEAVAQLTIVQRVLGIRQITEQALKDLIGRLSRRDAEKEALAALQTRVEELQSEKEQAEDNHQVLIEALDEAQLGAEVARMDVEARDAKIEWLESRLKEQGDYEAAYLEVPEAFKTSRPRNFAEFLDRVDQLPSVSFTGDPSDVERLNQVDTNDAALRVAWDAVLAIEGYARARHEGACNQGLDHYLQHTPAGYQTFPPGKFGETETGITMRQFGAERLFPVPEHVDPRGEVLMKAHFKLAQIGMATPRMYIYDGHPGESMVYIGYLGTHLTNTQTR